MTDIIRAGPGARGWEIGGDWSAKLSAPGSWAGTLQRAMLALLLEHQDAGMLPTNGQFLWYELEQRGVVDKMKRRGHPGVKRGHDQDLTDARIRLHEAGIIPWDWIVDETRTVYQYTAYPTIREGLLAAVGVTHLDPWDGGPPFLLAESRSLTGAIAGLAGQYRVPLSATIGQNAGHLHNEAAPAMHDGQLVLYLGDADLAGTDIEGNNQRVLEGYHALKWERLAITRAQLDQVRTRPDGSTWTLWDERIRKTDGRHTRRTCCQGMGDDGQGAGHDAVETEALGQAEITAIVRGRLDELLADRGVSLADVQVRQQAEREQLRELLDEGR